MEDGGRRKPPISQATAERSTGRCKGLARRVSRAGGEGIVGPLELTFTAAGELGEIVARRRIANLELRKAQEACEAATRAAAAALSNAGIALAAIGVVLDLSKTRVHQLLTLQIGQSFSALNETPTGDDRSAD